MTGLRGENGRDGVDGTHGRDGVDGRELIRSVWMFENDSPDARRTGIIDYYSDNTTRTRMVQLNSAGRPIALE
jgi:hypothetical protein